MARRVRSDFESRGNRLKLRPRRKPFNAARLGRGLLLLYRRNRGNGAWILKASDGHAKYWTKAFGQSDDFDTADGKTILTYFQAVDTAKRLAGGSGGTEADATAPITVDGALVDYRADLISRGARPYNSDHVRLHLSAALLSKPVQLLGSKELLKWRDGLLGKIAPATVNRVCNSMCAALEQARQHDPLRIKNAEAWEIGLAGLPNAQTARNVVIDDDTVRRFIAAAYRHDPQLGLLVDVLATTGARPIQAARLRCEDLRDHPATPTIMLPRSGKGGGRLRSQRKNERYSVPISVSLAKRLKAAAAGRAPDAALLMRSNGSPWGEDPNGHYRFPIREVVAAIGEDPDIVTAYCLRHSNITRMLLKNIPVRLIASLHNTSIHQIEKNYSRHITEHSSDALSRSGLLSEPPASTANVVTLAR